MSKSKEALRRLWQETAPATYMKDFNKKECCDAIERDLNILEILKKHIVGVAQRDNDGEKEFYVGLVEDVEQNYGYIYLFVSEEEYNKVKEWLEKE